MEWIKRSTTACTCFLTIAILSSSVLGVIKHKHSENFSSKQYCDIDSTSALWDTLSGELKLWSFEPTLVGTYNTAGDAYDLAISGDVAYVSDFNSVLAVDISNLQSPTLIGSYSISGCVDVTVAGDHAYAACGEGLRVLNISDPSNLTLVGSYNTSGWAGGVDVDGDYAYVADGTAGLRVIDISDPTNPTLAGAYYTTGSASGVDVDGDYAYVADGTAGLKAIDISDPMNPTLSGSYDTPDVARKVVVSGDNAFVADGISGLQVINISDPSVPSSSGNCITPGDAFGIAVEGDCAYIAADDEGLQVIDISDPENPTIIDSYNTLGFSYGVAVSGEHVFVADYNFGLQIIDAADPTNPVFESYSPPDNLDKWDVAVAGNYAYVSSHDSILLVYDISDPFNPYLAASSPYNAGWPTYDICGLDISGNYVYVAGQRFYDGVLWVFDISDPLTPTVIDSVEISSGMFYDVKISGDYAYAAAGYDDLQVIDISDPTNPSIVGSSTWVGGSTKAIDVAGDHAYLACGDQGLKVVDISTPTSPLLVGTYDTPGNARDIVLAGDYAYVADDDSGLQVINIINPANPIFAGVLIPDSLNSILAVAVAGDYAFVCKNFSDPMEVIDISDPTNPVVVASYTLGLYGWNIAISGDYVYWSGTVLTVAQVFQREFDLRRNVGQSLALDETVHRINSVKISSTQTELVHWEVNPNGGDALSWQDILPDGSWQLLTNSGSDLLWRSKHFYQGGGVNPACSNLEIEWLYDGAIIDSVVDVPNDQGKMVNIYWTRSGYDYAGSPIPIDQYAIFRKIDTDLSANLHRSIQPDSKINKNSQPLFYPPGDWDFLALVTANGSESYLAAVPTLKDSTLAEGMYHTTFFVRAGTDTLGMYFDSDPDSGYSLDNLAPQSPSGFAVVFTGSDIELSWESCPDTDFQYFCIYREMNPEFTPAPGNLVHMTVDTSWVDGIPDGWKYHYKLTAVDFSGNESPPSSPETISDIEGEHVLERSALYQNIPNPFNPMTRIRYQLKTQKYVALKVYDVAGKLVVTLVDGELPAGRYETTWDAKGMPSGIYFYRLTAGSFRQTRKMVLLK